MFSHRVGSSNSLVIIILRLKIDAVFKNINIKIREEGGE
jgi:hypothetical protein